MKPWLCDILACPKDKYYPLDLYIFSFETSEEKFKEIITCYEERDINNIRAEKIIKIQEEKGIIFIKDDIVLEKSSINNYLNLILSSIGEFETIYDRTPFKASKRCINIIREEARRNIIKFTDINEFKNLEPILPELYLLNKIKTEIEIDTGLLFCKECKRWYPIIETIPQMLPDEYRNENAEIEFLKTNKDLLDSSFFKQNLKPYNI